MHAEFPHWHTAMTFGTEKLEWCGYQTMKNFEGTFIRFYREKEEGEGKLWFQTGADGARLASLGKSI